MRLVGREGRPYIVCSRQPKAAPPPKPTPSTIRVVQPAPSLTCCKCGMINTIAFALLECTSCNSKVFDWTCGCVQRPQAPGSGDFAIHTPIPAPVFSTPPRVASSSSSAAPSLLSCMGEEPTSTPPTNEIVKRQPRRAPPKKTWCEQIKYIGPLGRYTVYHKIDCPTVPPGQALVATIEFANAYSLKPAPCCFAS